MHAWVSVCMLVHLCVHMQIHVCMCACTWSCMCTSACICVCLHTCACTHVHICTHKIVHVGTFIDTKFCVQLHSCACTSTRMCSHSCACPAGCALCICTHLWGGQGVLQSCSAPFGHGVLKHVCLCEKRQQIFLSAAAGKGCQYCRRSTRHQRGTGSHSAFSHFTISAFSIITLCL